jgi:hypothetical protein
LEFCQPFQFIGLDACRARFDIEHHRWIDRLTANRQHVHQETWKQPFHESMKRMPTFSSSDHSAVRPLRARQMGSNNHDFWTPMLV